MSFETEVLSVFPGAYPQMEFLASIQERLNDRGFEPWNTIVGVSVCREEPSCFLVEDLRTLWGTVYNFCTLSGLPFVGISAFRKMQQVVKADQGEGHFVFMAFPHIKWKPERGKKSVSACQGQESYFGGCSGLLNFQQGQTGESTKRNLDIDNLEQSLINQRLSHYQPVDEVSDVVALTKLTYRTILEDVDRLAGRAFMTSRCRYAIVTGIQINGPDQQDWIWPGHMFMVTLGSKRPLSLL